MISNCEENQNLHSMWEFLDIPLDVPLTREDVQKYRRDKRLKDDISFRKQQRKMFNNEFYVMAKQFPNSTGRQLVLFCSKSEKPSDFHLKRAKILSSVCLTAKEPLSQGYFEKLPTVIHEKILTFLTGLGDLQTRALWMSMRSKLNKYDRAYIKNASLARSETSFLDRVSMNLFEQLKSRRNRSQINAERAVNFEEWQKNFLEIIRLKNERRLAIIRSKSSNIGQELLCSVGMKEVREISIDYRYDVSRKRRRSEKDVTHLLNMEER